MREKRRSEAFLCSLEQLRSEQPHFLNPEPFSRAVTTQPLRDITRFTLNTQRSFMQRFTASISLLHWRCFRRPPPQHQVCLVERAYNLLLTSVRAAARPRLSFARDPTAAFAGFA